jgi:hypothetical protein
VPGKAWSRASGIIKQADRGDRDLPRLKTATLALVSCQAFAPNGINMFYWSSAPPSLSGLLMKQLHPQTLLGAFTVQNQFESSFFQRWSS